MTFIGLHLVFRLQETLQTFGAKEVSYALRDPTDERAFGFVSQTPEHKFKFYAIKTAETVTLSVKWQCRGIYVVQSDYAMISVRDMFVNIYEMKKKQAHSD